MMRQIKVVFGASSLPAQTYWVSAGTARAERLIAYVEGVLTDRERLLAVERRLAENGAQ